MKRQIVLYAAALVVGAFLIQWLEHRFLAHTQSLNAVVLILVTGFALLGVWVGTKLVSRVPAGEFEINQAAMTSLGISAREYEVLQKITAGRSNKEIARELGISPNTVKTHVTSLFNKLDVSRRTEAINRSRELRLIP